MWSERNPIGHSYDRRHAVGFRLSQVLADVRAQPRILGTSTAALIHGREIADAQRCGNEPCCLRVLRLVRISLGHRDRDTVRGEHQPRVCTESDGETLERFADMVGVRLNEPGVHVPVVHVGDLDVRQPALAEPGARRDDVLAVLQTSGVAAVSGGDEPDGAANAMPRHIGQRVLEKRMPVTHSDVHGQHRSGTPQSLPQPLGLPHSQHRQRRDAAEQLVVVGDFLDAFGSHTAAAEHVGEKRPDIGGAVGPAEGYDQNSVKWLAHRAGDYTVRAALFAEVRMSVTQYRAVTDAARIDRRSSAVTAADAAMSPLPGVATTRLVSLDVFRGLTVAAMVIVNNPGDGANVYWPLDHAKWNGWTPTDLIFPFFLFIVGVSITLSRRTTSWTDIARRASIILAIGLFLAGYPRFDVTRWRIPGVLPRIAVCYLIAAVAYRMVRGDRARRGLILGLIAAACMVVYWIVMTAIPNPAGVRGDLTPDGNWGAYIDRAVFGSHLWVSSKTWDPEGLLRYVPAVATTLLGIVAGLWLGSNASASRKALWLAVAGDCRARARGTVEHRVPDQQEPLDQLVRRVHCRLCRLAAGDQLLGDRRQGLARLDEAVRCARRKRDHALRGVCAARQDHGAHQSARR